jgi:putative phosphoesterase
MRKIGLLSDTHGYADPKLYDFFKECDEIWHAGDIGSTEVAEKLERWKKLKAVYGNIDDLTLRNKYPEHQRFQCEETDVWITHIGGYPGRYDKLIKNEIKRNPPDLFICGHSHILKVQYDKELDLLHINPGAAGKSGFHKYRTAVRFDIDKEEIKNLEVFEIIRK